MLRFARVRARRLALNATCFAAKRSDACERQGFALVKTLSIERYWAPAIPESSQSQQNVVKSIFQRWGAKAACRPRETAVHLQIELLWPGDRLSD
jgi:hypothetical protein